MIQDYHPDIQNSQGELPEDLETLIEALAEQVHDTWASERIRNGWTYGPERCDSKKQTPLLIPYEDLPPEEKVFDRNTAMETLRYILNHGYEIRKVIRNTKPGCPSDKTDAEA